MTVQVTYEGIHHLPLVILDLGVNLGYQQTARCLVPFYPAGVFDVLPAPLPQLGDRLKLDKPNQQIIDFTVAELKAIKQRPRAMIPAADSFFWHRPDSVQKVASANTTAQVGENVRRVRSLYCA